MDLIVQLDGETLAAMQSDLERMYTFESKTRRVYRDLNSVALIDFCTILLQHLNDEDVVSIVSYLRQLRMICLIFDAVDIDSRGYISWSDFTAFCLRMGRIYLNSSFLLSGTMYCQSSTTSPVLPVKSLFHLNHSQTLYAIDIDTPTIRAFRNNGSYTSKFNPLKELDRLKRVQASNVSLSGALRNKTGPVQVVYHKVAILCATFIEKLHQLILCTSDAHVIFCTEADNSFHVVGYTRPENPQVGICFCRRTETLLSWPGDPSSHYFHIWDPIRMILLFQISRHDCLIMAVCEVTLNTSVSGKNSDLHLDVDYIASCSLDRKLLLWPITAVTRSGGEGQGGGQETVDRRTHTLRGHRHALRSLVYASEHELLIGAGFDFDIYAWDPWTKRLQMKLVGHLTSIVSIQLAFIPHERLLSVDDVGVMKVWTLGQGASSKVEVLQSLQLQLAGKEKMVISDFVTMSDGKSLAILASNRVYYFSLDNGHVDDLRPVPGGLGYCERMGRLWLCCRKSVCQGRLSDGMTLRRLGFIDDDRFDAKKLAFDEKRRQLRDRPGSAAKGKASLRGNVGDDSEIPTSHAHAHANPHDNPALVDKGAQASTDAEVFNDMISCVVSDVIGKKIFVGTVQGHVMIFDSASFGFVAHLGRPPLPHEVKHIVHDKIRTLEETDHPRSSGGRGHPASHPNPSTRQPGSSGPGAPLGLSAVDIQHLGPDLVASLLYCERDELVIAAYTFGAIRVFNGCYRGSRDAPDDKFPGGSGGTPGCHTSLFRECDYGFEKSHDTCVVSAAFSERFNLIAVSVRNGSIRIFDYFTLSLYNIYSVPFLDGQSVECTGLCFLDLLPVVVASDNFGRVSLFSVAPLTPQWIYTFCPLSEFGDSAIEEAHSKTQNSGAAIRSLISVYYQMPVALIAPVAAPIPPSISAPPGGKPTSIQPIMRQDSAESKQLPKPKEAKEPFRFSGQSVPKPRTVKPLAESKVKEGEGKEKKTKDGRVKAGEAVGNKEQGPQTPPELFKRKWKILCGDELGRVMKMDITPLLTKAGCLDALTFPVADYRSYAYLEVKKYRMFQGLTVAAINAIEYQMKRPIGFHVNEFTRSCNGVNVKDVLFVKRWTAHGGVAVRAITPIIETRHRYKVGSIAHASYEPPASPPTMILTASDMGVVKNWTWNGEFLGEMADEPVNPMAVQQPTVRGKISKRGGAASKDLSGSICVIMPSQTGEGFIPHPTGEVSGSVADLKKTSTSQVVDATMSHVLDASNALLEDSQVSKVSHFGWKIPRGIYNAVFGTEAQQQPKLSDRRPNKDFVGSMVAWVLPKIDTVGISLAANTRQLSFSNINELTSLEGPSPLLASMSIMSEGKPDPALFLDALARKSRSFAESCSHAPLDFHPSDSLDPHDFHASVLNTGEWMHQYMDEKSIRHQAEQHLVMVNEFRDLWNVKVRMKNLESELNNGIFNCIADPAVALGKANYRTSLSKAKRVTGIDFIVTKELKAYELLHPEIHDELPLRLRKKCAKRPLSRSSGKSSRAALGGREGLVIPEEVVNDVVPGNHLDDAESADPSVSGFVMEDQALSVEKEEEEKEEEEPSPTKVALAELRAVPALPSPSPTPSPAKRSSSPESHTPAAPKVRTALDKLKAVTRTIIAVNAFSRAGLLRLSTSGSPATVARVEKMDSIIGHLDESTTILADAPALSSSRPRPQSAPSAVSFHLSPKEKPAKASQSQSQSSKSEPAPSQQPEKTARELLSDRVQGTLKRFDEIISKVDEEVVVTKVKKSHSVSEARKSWRKNENIGLDGEDGSVIDVVKRNESLKRLETHRVQHYVLPTVNKNQRNRYGPYRFKDFFWFVEFVHHIVETTKKYESLRIRHISAPSLKLKASKSMPILDGSETIMDDVNRLDLAILEMKPSLPPVHFVEDDYGLPVDIVIAHCELLPDSETFISAVEAIPVNSIDPCVYKMDLIKIFFPHAYTQEQSRILTFTKVTEILWSILGICQSNPRQQLTRRAAVAETTEKLNPRDARAVHAYLQSQLMMKKRSALANKITAESDSGFLKILDPNVATGLQGWKIERLHLMELVDSFQRWSEFDCGTVSLHDTVEIIQSMVPHSKLVACRPLLMLAQRLTSAGFNMDAEVDGAMVQHLIEDGLKLIK